MHNPSILDRLDLITALSESRRDEVEFQALDRGWGLYHLDLRSVVGLEEMYRCVLRSLGCYEPAGYINFDHYRDLLRELRARPEKEALLCVSAAEEFFARKFFSAAQFVRLLTSIRAELLHIVPEAPQHRVALWVVFFGAGIEYPEEVDGE